MDAKCNGGAGSEGDEGAVLRSPLNANGISSRKRIKLQGKVSEICAPVDPALVPRRLRSAVIKRVSQSASPPLPELNRRERHASNRRERHASGGSQLFLNSSTQLVKQDLQDAVTRDEEEVAETLTSMACLISSGPIVKSKENSRLFEEQLEAKATSSSLVQASEEEASRFLLPCDGTTTGLSPPVEGSHQNEKAPLTLDQPAAASVSKKSEAEANGCSLPHSPMKHSSNMEPIAGVPPKRDASSFSNSLGASIQYFPINGMLQSTQLDALVQKAELGLWPLGPALEQNVQSIRQKSHSARHDVNQKDYDLQPGSQSKTHEMLTMASLGKTEVPPNSVTFSGRSSSTNALPAAKISLVTADKKRPWKRCSTHVYLSHLIQRYQKAEKQQIPAAQGNQSKAKDKETSMPISGKGSKNGLISPPSGLSSLERTMLEAQNRMLQQNGRLLQAQQAGGLSGAYAQQKQGCDLLSLSASGDTKSSCNGGIKNSGQLHAPYTPIQTVLPFAFPQVPYNSQYQEHLQSGATQQVQLQLPHYIVNSQLYGPQTGQAGGAASKQQQHQQQLMWQAHLAQFRPPVGSPPNWQNSHQHGSSSAPPASHPSAIFPLPPDYNPQNFHQFLQQQFILPSPSSLPSRSKQQHSVNGLNPRSSSQLQMVCNAESFR